MNDVAQLTKVNALDKEGVQTLLAYMQSKTVEDAARALGITRQGLWLRVKKYKLDEIISEVPKEALMRLQLGSTKAAEKLVEKLDDRHEGLQAATEILDRVGLTGDKPTVVQQFNVGGDMGVEFVKNE